MFTSPLLTWDEWSKDVRFFFFLLYAQGSVFNPYFLTPHDAAWEREQRNFAKKDKPIYFVRMFVWFYIYIRWTIDLVRIFVI